MQLAREAGRLDDWRAYLAELHPDEFDILYALSLVEPWGEARADKRAAWFLEMLAALFGKELQIGPKELDYLGLLKHEDLYATFDEIAAALGAHE